MDEALAASDISGRMVAWAQVAIGVGMMLGPLAAAPIAERNGLRAVMWSSAATCLVALAMALPALSARVESSGHVDPHE